METRQMLLALKGILLDASPAPPVAVRIQGLLPLHSQHSMPPPYYFRRSPTLPFTLPRGLATSTNASKATTRDLSRRADGRARLGREVCEEGHALPAAAAVFGPARARDEALASWRARGSRENGNERESWRQSETSESRSLELWVEFGDGDGRGGDGQEQVEERAALSCEAMFAFLLFPPVRSRYRSSPHSRQLTKLHFLQHIRCSLSFACRFGESEPSCALPLQRRRWRGNGSAVSANDCRPSLI